MLEVDNPGEDICRDYMRNVCARGNKCRFKHPHKKETNFSGDANSVKEERKKFVQMFCHDFQNTYCSREECKYIHCSKEEHDLFMNSGCLPPYVLEDAISKSIIPALPTEVPVCKDYLSGECRRGKSCRYRHLTHSRYRGELNVLFGVNAANNDGSHFQIESESKRFKSACITDVVSLNGQPIQGYFPHEKCNIHLMNMYLNSNRYTNNDTEYPTEINIQEENIFLRKRVEELKKQLSDLSAANEFLLEQNAQLRLSRKTAANMTTVTPVSVTVTGTPVSVQPGTGQLVTTATPAVLSQLSGQTNTGQIVAVSTGQTPSGQQLVPVSIAPGSLTAASGQQILSTGTLSTMTVAGQTSTGQLVTAAVPVSCNATGQIMAAVSTVTVAGQSGTTQQIVTATVPVSSQQQQLVPVSTSQLVPVSTQQLVPVSISGVSMAPVNIPPAIVTVTNSQSQTSFPIVISSRQSLMSYPMRTHSVLQTNLTR